MIYDLSGLSIGELLKLTNACNVEILKRSWWIYSGIIGVCVVLVIIDRIKEK